MVMAKTAVSRPSIQTHADSPLERRGCSMRAAPHHDFITHRPEVISQFANFLEGTFQE